MHKLSHPAPFSARNQHPAQLTAMHVSPRPARATPAGRVDAETSVDWTSLWLRPVDARDRIELDGELVRLVPRARVGLGDGFDLSIELPFLHAGGGSLDSFIEAWHDALRLPQNQRDEFPRNQFRARAERRAPSNVLETAYELDPVDFEVGDVPIRFAWFPHAWQNDVASFGFRAGFELPTGSEEKGVGNGELDAMLGVVAGYHAGSWAVTGWGGYAWIGTADTARAIGVEYEDHPSAGAAIELGLAEWISVLGQVEWERSILGKLQTDRASRDQVLVWFGARLRPAADFELDLAIGEDLVRNVSPDVTLHLTARLRL